MNVLNPLFFQSFVLCAFSFAQVPCDQEIEAIENDETAYMTRGNRCEGFYKSDVASNSIDLMGVLKGQLVYELNESETIEISTSPSISRPLHLRAQGNPA